MLCCSAAGTSTRSSSTWGCVAVYWTGLDYPLLSAADCQGLKPEPISEAEAEAEAKEEAGPCRSRSLRDDSQKGKDNGKSNGKSNDNGKSNGNYRGPSLRSRMTNLGWGRRALGGDGL
jgi:hypothetical protein